MIQRTTNKAAIFRPRTGMVWECTAIAGVTMAPGRLHTLFAEKAMAPFPAILQKQNLKCSICCKSQVPQLKIKMSY